MDLRPDILTHPNIPKPLHGMSPRVVKGVEWWDKTRRGVYSAQRYRCIACGIHKGDAKYHNWIEAHESYTIDYKKGCMEIQEIVGLCHSCHAFIHCGRLTMMWGKGVITECKYFDIMYHGFKVLREAGITPNYMQVCSYIDARVSAGREVSNTLRERADMISEISKEPEVQQDWTKWHMILEGKKYYSKFKSIRDWEEHYR